MMLPLYLLAALFVVFPLGCSSIPDFKPSTPVEKVANFQDALAVCATYQIEAKEGASVKVASMVPWIRCFESTFKKFPEALQNRHFVIFFRALQIRHDFVVAPHDTIREPRRLNQLVKNALAMIQNPSQSSLVNENDYRYAQKELPRYASYLEERRDFKGATSRASLVSDELGVLAEDFQNGVNDGALNKGHGSLTAPQKQYCARYRGYLGKLSNLKELVEYKDILAQQSQEDPSQLVRVQKRVDALKSECLQDRQLLSKERDAIKAKTSWFDNVRCFR